MWLNQACRSNCELCLEEFNAIKTLRYHCCESAWVWIKRPRNRTLICFLLTICGVGIMLMCLIGMQFFLLDGPKWGVANGAIMAFLSLVSWIRKRDLHILTAGILTYTSDQRFQVIRPDKSDNWTLQIKFPQKRDEGIYECQVNTEPKMSLAFRLNIVESKARILGPAELYVKSGSAVSVTCVISQGPHDLGTVFWYRDADMLHVETERRVRIDTDWTEALTSRLQISDAITTDSGNYSCVPTVAAPASVNVHVINGEHPAAMQHGNKNTAPLIPSIHCSLVYTITVFAIKHIR
ncbi:defective proboscis extension response 1 [Carabus blaptoides fortunei]